MNTKDELLGPAKIGNSDKISLLEFADNILDLTGSKSKIIHLTLPQDDPRQHRLDINLNQEVLNGWQPRINLRRGPIKTIQYFDKALSNAL